MRAAQTTIMDYGYIVGPYKGNIGVILGLHWGYIGDNGKEHGNFLVNPESIGDPPQLNCSLNSFKGVI